MKNLKIRVNNEAEAEEVKRLAVKAGYKLDALFGKKCSAEFCYLVLCEDMSAGFGNEIMAGGDKPLSIGELRDMVVLKRNDVSDATHTDQDNWSWYISSNGDGYVWQCGNSQQLKQWDKASLDFVDLKPIEKTMKEYLMPFEGGYSYILTDAREGLEPHAKDWIEIPEGAVKFLFSRENGSKYHFANENNKLMSLTEINCGNHYWYGNAKNYMSQCKVDVLWQREQDEPFLTPECTLNDQYAEIEQVRQAIKVKSGSDSNHELDAMSFGLIGARAAQASGGVDATLAERQSTYGNFEDVAFVTENIMSILAKVRVNGLDDLPNTHRMALYMIASKMARIVNGDFNHLDSWHDIGGYSKLIEKLIKGE